MTHTAKTKRGRNGSKWPGICSRAKSLGVNRNTLLRVLKGEWKSRILTARYRQLTGKKLSTDEQLLIADFNRREQRRKKAEH